MPRTMRKRDQTLTAFSAASSICIDDQFRQTGETENEAIWTYGRRGRDDGSRNRR
jgi:hypothetical protein